MVQVERHIVGRSDSRYARIDHVCWLSKNLYNAGLYAIKQEFLRSGKWIRWIELNKQFLSENNVDYRALSAWSSNNILHRLDQNLKGYFSSIKAWKRDNKKFTGCPRFPRYKDKTKGRFAFVYASHTVRLLDGMLYFPKKEGFSPLRTRVTGGIHEVRFIPRHGYYVIEVVYEVPDAEELPDSGRYLSIDLGLDNLATCYDSNGFSFIINGRSLKSINQYYNKRRGELQRSLQKQHGLNHSRRLDRLTLRRNNKVDDYLHKASRLMVNYCRDHGINRIVVGYNPGWKDYINLGSVTNQNFVCLPHGRFVEMLRYKSKVLGIGFVDVNESHTSVCSSLDREAVCHHDVYVGKRIRRGLFRSGIGLLINADVNGSVNILRKVFGDDVAMRCLVNRGHVVCPVRVCADRVVGGLVLNCI